MLTDWCILDPGLESKNLGDSIISKHATKQLLTMLGPAARITSLPTHRFWSDSERQRARECDRFIFAGSNALAHNFPLNFQWVIRPSDFRMLRGKLTLFGVGTWNYGKFSPVSKSLWSSVLSEEPHSTRDSYTQVRLELLGKKAVTTGCPTLWNLPDSFSLGKRKEGCIFTVTDYRMNPTRDLNWLNFLRDNYDELLLWPQGSGDEGYFRRLNLGAKVEVLPRDLSAFENALSTNSFDYFGTRLHAGIHALHAGLRASIVGVDNRAKEMANDFNIPVLLDGEFFTHLERERVSLSLPRKKIEDFRKMLREV